MATLHEILKKQTSWVSYLGWGKLYVKYQQFRFIHIQKWTDKIQNFKMTVEPPFFVGIENYITGTLHFSEQAVCEVRYISCFDLSISKNKRF